LTGREPTGAGLEGGGPDVPAEAGVAVADAAVPRFYRHAFSSSADLLALCDARIRYIAVNRAYAAAFGAAPAELVGRPVGAVLGTGELERRQRLRMERCLAGRALRYQVRYDFPALGPRSLDVRLEPVAGHGGEVLGIAYVARDITELTRVREHLERYEAIVSASGDLMSVVDRDFRYRLVNDAYVRAFGRPRDAIIGRHVADLIGEDEFERETRPRLEWCFGGDAVRYEIEVPLARGPCVLDVRLDPVRDESGAVSGAAVAARDVTEERRTRAALARTESELRAIFDNVPAHVLLKDAERRYLRVNRDFEKLFGLSAAHFIGRRAEEVPALSESGIAEFATAHDLEVLRTGRAVERLESLRCEGRTLTALTLKFPVRDEAGRVTGIGGIGTDVTLQRQAEERFRTLADNVPGLFAYIGPDRRYEYVNRHYRQWFGIPAAEIVGQSMAELLGEEVHAAVRPAYERALAGERVELELLAPYRHGGTRWVNAVYTPDVDDAGAVRGVFVLVTDVSERKRAEERFRALADNVPGLFLYLDREYRYRYVNREWERWFGSPAAEVEGRHAADCIGREHFELARPGWERALAGERVERETRVRLPGGPRWVHSMYSPDVGEDGGVRGIFILVRDIEAQKQTETRLRRSEQQFREIAEHVRDVFWIAPPQGCPMTYVSPACRDMTGYAPEEFYATPGLWQGLLHPDDRARVLATVNDLAAGRGFDVEYRLRHRDGSVRWVRDRAFVVRGEDEAVQRVIGVAEDVTERRRGEEALRASRERLRNLAARLHSVSEEESRRMAREIHDELGQKLTRLRMDLDWIDGQLREDQTDLAGCVRSAKQMLGDVFGSVRRISSRLRPPILDDMGLAAAVEWLVDDFRSRARWRIDLDLRAEHLGPDPDRDTALFRILQEALTNAARHSGASRVDVRLVADAATVLLEVRDDGRGISVAALEDARSHGLVGMRERAGAIGGRVRVERAAPCGTLVRVRAPTGEPDTGETGVETQV